MITLEQYVNPYGYIYEIKNLINGKKYIGQTINKKGVRGAMTLIGIKNYYRDNTYLVRSVEKYGIKNFERKIIDSAKEKRELDKKEEYYIQKYNTLNRDYGYNLKHGGSNGSLSLESRKKISKSKKGKYKKENNPNWRGGGIKHNCEYCGKKVIREYWRYKKSKNHFCSKKCYHQWEKGKIIPKELITKRIKHFFTKEYLIIEYWGSKWNMENNILNILQKGILEIAKENNCVYNTIRNNLIKNNIPIRTKSESKILIDIKRKLKEEFLK